MVEGIEILKKYFPALPADKLQQYQKLADLTVEWNEKINVISRKDIPNYFLHHVVHSLAISLFLQFRPGTTVLDVGTGGGYPGLPLAILFPEARFTLVDSIGKKTKVVADIIQQLGLENATARQVRAEEMKEKFDFVTGRAVTDLSVFEAWVRKRIRPGAKNSVPNGILYLKGGDIANDRKAFGKRLTALPLTHYFPEPHFEEKYLLYIEA